MARTLVNSVIIKPATTAQVGDVVQSMLTEAQFQAERDGTWVLADGRDVTGSKYATVTGNTTVPDMRGQFLRGLDTSGTIDPDGAGRSLGDSQADEFKSHAHTTSDIFRYDKGGGSAGADRYLDVDLQGRGTPTINPSGGDETRPKNVAVNIFIKID